ncbi:MAG: hypothetical protein KGJ08_00145 [Gammaproteobacteria bacterium]|nr:hypothetical protein [Gammaproteobacteria bacterium]
MHQHTSSFSGASGADYSYAVFPQHFVPQDQQFYNYMFASLSPEGRWNPVFIGQGDLKQYLNDQAHIRGVAHSRSTHVLAHISPDAQQRRMEASDMLASHPQALALSGCNPGTAKTVGRIPSQNKSAKRAFPNDQVFKNRAPSLRSQDTVWARLRAKVKI